MKICGQRRYVVSSKRPTPVSVRNEHQASLKLSQVSSSDGLDSLDQLWDQTPSTLELTGITANNVARPGGKF